MGNHDNIKDHYNSEGIDPKDLDNLRLELNTLPNSDILAVFIKDPEDPKRYWHRSIKVVPGKNTTSKRVGVVDYIDILTHDMGEFDIIPCPEEHLRIALHQTKKYREKDENNPEDECMDSAVGMAVYDGKNLLSLEQIISLVGVKYHNIRQSFISSQN